MSNPAGLVTIDADVARNAVVRILTGLGSSERDAETVANVLVEADLRGQHSHGIMRLPTIVGRVRAGLIRPRATMIETKSAESVVLLDGAFGFGHVTATRAMILAEEAASRTGIGIVGVTNNNHIGMLGYYVESSARRGFVGFAATTTEAMVHPHGGVERLLGTNPIAIGVPALPEPFVLDFSTSATAIGKILDAVQRDSPIPSDWAVDGNGEPTTQASSALDGAINPFGGAKGYGLGLAVALLAGVMVGSASNPQVVGTLDSEFVVNKGDLFIAIDTRVFPGGSTMAERSGELLEQIRSSRPAPGVPGVLVPGDRGRARRSEHLSNGMRFPEALWRTIVRLEEEIAHKPQGASGAT